MKVSFEVKRDVIIRRFKGDISPEDMFNSWKELFKRFDDLSSYKGIITTFEAIPPGDTPGTIKKMVDHYVKFMQIRPFIFEEAAMRWISP